MLGLISKLFFIGLTLFICVLMFMNPSEARFTEEFKGNFEQAIQTDF